MRAAASPRPGRWLGWPPTRGGRRSPGRRGRPAGRAGCRSGGRGRDLGQTERRAARGPGRRGRADPGRPGTVFAATGTPACGGPTTTGWPAAAGPAGCPTPRRWPSPCAVPSGSLRAGLSGRGVWSSFRWTRPPRVAAFPGATLGAVPPPPRPAPARGRGGSAWTSRWRRRRGCARARCRRSSSRTTAGRTRPACSTRAARSPRYLGLVHVQVHHRGDGPLHDVRVRVLASSAPPPPGRPPRATGSGPATPTRPLAPGRPPIPPRPAPGLFRRRQPRLVWSLDPTRRSPPAAATSAGAVDTEPFHPHRPRRTSSPGTGRWGCKNSHRAGGGAGAGVAAEPGVGTFGGGRRAGRGGVGGGVRTAGLAPPRGSGERPGGAGW